MRVMENVYEKGTETTVIKCVYAPFCWPCLLGIKYPKNYPLLYGFELASLPQVPLFSWVKETLWPDFGDRQHRQRCSNSNRNRIIRTPNKQNYIGKKHEYK